jgi:DNA-binding NtrC family response regulator
MTGALAFGKTMNLNSKKLLIVEDNESLQQMLAWEFEEMGYQVTAAGCCDSARQAAASEQFDLALVDCNLPDGCGSKLITELHKCQPKLPVILCSGRMSEEGLQTGAYCFIPKPVTAKSLHMIFQQALTGTES